MKSLYPLQTLFLGAVLALLCCSCTTPLSMQPDPNCPRYGYAPGKTPVFYILYHPYGKSMERQLGEPMLDYAPGSWSDQRMDRDLERLAGAGIDGLICVLTVDDLAKEEVHERLKTFAAKAMAPARKLRLAFMLDAPAGTPNAKITAAASSFASFLLASGIPDQEQYQTRQDRDDARPKPVVFLAPDASFAFVRHPGVVFVRTGGAAPAWIVDPGLQAPPVLTRDGTQAVVPVATYDPDTRTWLLPQDGGQTLGEALKATVALHPEVIVFASWNDYASGRFIEPSWTDQGATLQRFRQEMALLRRNLAPTPVP